MNIGIIDADLIGRKKHRFPNLASMKISAFHKNAGDTVTLCTDYNALDGFDKIYLSKVFTDTEVPPEVLSLPNVSIGGTGFYYDKAPKLPEEIEHICPDYHLYDEWVQDKLDNGGKRKDFTAYLDYSIGFLTRGCFRQCPFCVNQNYKRCNQHSPVDEFLDPERPKLCFLDDNFFACPEWKSIIDEVKATGKRFQFRQGLDERLLTDDKIHELMQWKYDGRYIFAFDNIADRPVIEDKLKRIHELYPITKSKCRFKFYVLCGFDRNDKYDDEFWMSDIRDAFERVKVLASYNALPYIMRFEKAYTSKYAGTYISLAGWCNQPQMFKTLTFRDFCRCKGMNSYYKEYRMDFDRYIQDGKTKGRAWRDMEELERICPDIARDYFDVKMTYENLNR